MEIVFRIFGGLTGLFGIFVLLTAMRKGFSHKGTTLSGLCYLLGGIGSFYFISWWPALLGIILTLFIRRILGVTDYVKTPDYGFALSKNETGDVEKVGKFILDFLKSDSIGKNLLNPETQQWAASGFISKFSFELKLGEPLTKNLVPWFMNYMRPKIQALSNYDPEEYNQLVRGLNDRSGRYLERTYQITTKYNIDDELFKSNTGGFLNSLSNEDKEKASYAIFADDITQTELRILQYLYSWWTP